MTTFCSNCGAPLAANTTFCPQCGNKVGNQPTPPLGAPAPMPAAKTGSGGALKVVLILLCCLVVLGAAVVGGIYYFVHRVERAVVQTAKENGVDLNSLSASASDSENSRHLPAACDVLSQQTVAELIDEPVDHTETNGHDCKYFGPAGLSAKLAEDETAAMSKLADSADNTKDPLKTLRAFQRPLMRQGAAQNNDSELPLVVITISPGGKTAMAALNFTKGMIGAIGKAQSREQAPDGKEKNLGDAFVGTEVPGLGDKAMWTPSTGLVVLKGDTLIGVNPGPIPDLETRTQALARAALAKL